MSSSAHSGSPEAATPPAGGYQAGDVIGRKYRLERLAGEGGMGAVWVALNTDLDTHVAIKLIRAGTPQVGAAERLLCEARAAAKLRHPAIVRVFDYGLTSRKDPFIVMELLDGESLRDRLAREGRFTPERSVQLMLPIAEALAAAHARGIVHRDLKPDNIVLATDDGGKVQPKVVDFGVAKLLRANADAGGSGLSVVGTPEYMAPEQALGLDAVDPRADVWAFCVVLYELITDAYLFSGETMDKTLHAVLNDPAPSLVDVAGVDPALWRIIERGLSKDRDQRWMSMQRLGRELAHWLLQQGIGEDVFGASIRSSWRGVPVGAALPAAKRPASASAAAPAAVSSPPPGAASAAPPPAAQARRSDRARSTGASLAQTVDPRSHAARLRARPASDAPALRSMAPSVVFAVAGVLVWALSGAGDSVTPEANAAPIASAAPVSPPGEISAPELPRAAAPPSQPDAVPAGLVGGEPAPDPGPKAATPKKKTPAKPARRSKRPLRPEEVDFGF